MDDSDSPVERLSPPGLSGLRLAAVWIPTAIALLGAVFAANLIFSQHSGQPAAAPATPTGSPTISDQPSPTPSPASPTPVATTSVGPTVTAHPPATSSHPATGNASSTPAASNTTLTAHIKGIGGLCLDDEYGHTANGTIIQLYQCEELEQQYWTWTSATGTVQAFSRCMRASNGGTASGSLVELWTCDGSAAQRWRFDSAGHLVNAAAGLCLNDPSSGSDYGIQLDVAGCRTAEAQKWTMS